MITAIDTNVMIDLLTDDSVHGESSRQLLIDAYDEGGLVICEVVYAELAPQFDSQAALDAVLKQLGIRRIQGGFDVAYRAGAEYRRSGGTRTRMIADFLIGAHASMHADRLLTRDRGFYRSSFADLDLLER